MTITSRNVTAQATATASDFNSLRSDVLDNHDHDGTGGTKVEHENLLHGSHTLVNDHEAIDDHIAASSGEHGKGASEYLPGIIGGNFAIIPFEYVNGITIRQSGHEGTNELFDFSAQTGITMASDEYYIIMSMRMSATKWHVTAKAHTLTTTTFTMNIYPVEAETYGEGHVRIHGIIIGVPAR